MLESYRYHDILYYLCADRAAFMLSKANVICNTEEDLNVDHLIWDHRAPWNKCFIHRCGGHNSCGVCPAVSASNQLTEKMGRLCY